jgi:hypothetical protein
MTESYKEVVLEKRRWSRLTTVSIALLILIGLATIAYYMWDSEPDPDRPPIIITTGSVIVDSGADWTDEGGNEWVEAIKGKSVKSYSASTGIGISGAACTVSGSTIVVTYGSSEIAFSRKRRWPWPGSKHDADVQFPKGATVSEPTAGELVVATSDGLVKFTNDKGDSCAVGADQRIELRQVH